MSYKDGAMLKTAKRVASSFPNVQNPSPFKETCYCCWNQKREQKKQSDIKLAASATFRFKFLHSSFLICLVLSVLKFSFEWYLCKHHSLVHSDLEFVLVKGLSLRVLVLKRAIWEYFVIVSICVFVSVWLWVTHWESCFLSVFVLRACSWVSSCVVSFVSLRLL